MPLDFSCCHSQSTIAWGDLFEAPLGDKCLIVVDESLDNSASQAFEKHHAACSVLLKYFSQAFVFDFYYLARGPTLRSSCVPGPVDQADPPESLALSLPGKGAGTPTRPSFAATLPQERGDGLCSQMN